MSLKNIQSNGLTQRGTDTLSTNFKNSTWVRNPSWVTFPSITSTDQKFIGIFAVYNTTDNFVALSAVDNYDVNWGDGTSDLNVASGTQINHNFSYSDPDLAGTDAPVTLTDSTDLVTRTSHGYIDGMTVSFYNIVSTTGITEGQEYYVINATTNTFQVSATVGGSAIVLTTDGTATLLPYKQAIVTVTPITGQLLQSINLDRIHNQAGLITTAGVTWLDIAMTGASLSTIALTNGSLKFQNCERVRVLKSTKSNWSLFFGSSICFQALRYFELQNTTVNNLITMFLNCYALTDVYFENVTVSISTSASSMFSGCRSLVNAPEFNTSNVTSMSSMFASCQKLEYLPLYNTSSVTNMGNMFSNCFSLQYVPLFNTSSVTNMSSMFTNCYSLTSVPLFNTVALAVMPSMFSNCYSLKSVPLFNTSNVTNMSSMFNSCYSLTSVPLFNTSNVTNMSGMFNSCYTLKSVPQFNTIAVTNMSLMFTGCNSLKTVPLFNTIAVTNTNSMFSDCFSLQSVPLLYTNLVTNCASMFLNCGALVTIPALNFNAVTTTATTTMFGNCNSLSAIKMINMRNTFSVASLKLSGAALDEIYTNLPTVTAKTITVTGNYGTTTDTPSIATAKGWTVTG